MRIGLITIGAIIGLVCLIAETILLAAGILLAPHNTQLNITDVTPSIHRDGKYVVVSITNNADKPLVAVSMKITCIRTNVYRLPLVNTAVLTTTKKTVAITLNTPEPLGRHGSASFLIDDPELMGCTGYEAVITGAVFYNSTSSTG